MKKYLHSCGIGEWRVNWSILHVDENWRRNRLQPQRAPSGFNKRRMRRRRSCYYTGRQEDISSIIWIILQETMKEMENNCQWNKHTRRSSAVAGKGKGDFENILKWMLRDIFGLTIKEHKITVIIGWKISNNDPFITKSVPYAEEEFRLFRI